MYYFDGVDVFVQEKIEGKYIKRQEIRYENSRFNKDLFFDEFCDGKFVVVVVIRLVVKQGKIGVDGLV